MSAAQEPLAGARAVVVNRTHRVVRAEALTMQEQKTKSRSLWAPILVSSFLILAIVYAIWAELDNYDITPNGVPDASDQIMLIVLWSLPVTLLVMGLVWLRRGRRAGGAEVQL